MSNLTRLLPGSPLYFCPKMANLTTGVSKRPSVVELAIHIFSALRVVCRCPEDLSGKGRGPGKDTRRAFNTA